MDDQSELLNTTIIRGSEYQLAELSNIEQTLTIQNNSTNQNIYTFSPHQENLETSETARNLNNMLLEEELTRPEFVTETNNLEIEGNAFSGNSETKLIEALKEIDEENWKYVLQRCKELNVDLENLTKMNRFHIDILVPVTNLGRNISFCHGFKKWKEKANFTNRITDNTGLTTAECSSVIQNQNIYVLKEIIKDKFDHINENYNKNKLLLPSDRNELVKSIVDYFKSRNIAMNISIFKNLARQISDYFPGESESYYYSKQPGKRAKGILLNRYSNLSRLKCEYKVQQNILEREHGQMLETLDQKRKTLNFEFSGGDFEMQWLKHNKGPFDKILDLWKETLEFRKQYFVKHIQNSTVCQILHDWPSYTLPDGYLLIDIDFSYKFDIPDVDFYEEWRKFETSIFKIFETELKTKNAKELFQKLLLRSDSSTDLKNAVIIQLMHNYLFPTQMFKEERSRKYKKYSIIDSQLSVIQIFKEPVQLDSLFQSSSPIQPFVIIIADDIFNIKQNVVYFDKRKYECGNFLKCFNTCFKIFNVFNLEYPKPARNFWYFFQILFKIPTGKNLLPPEAHNIISKLKLNIEKT
ncbi:uncharacterized protein LOC129607308 [Condylostylus longicornis]|uniref:uncharacterized protein LOC129607308 n=1 Tax=Condylostylus longicornis TaxID=2530218 RepID=UPI00244E26C4|nr:uncharacterized protein LOC129607308 [Condylostylus longicornis]